MRPTTLESLGCSGCGATLRATRVATEGERLRAGSLDCDACRRSVPVCCGFPLFPEERVGSAFAPEELAALERRCFGREEDYRAFLRAKFHRPVRDAYAFFQPFNEAARAFLPLVALLRERLRPGQRILDLGCRTGWSGELLAALFPEQEVVAVWEGESDVLGYRGYRFWLDAGRRAANLDVVFSPTGRPLPFRRDTFALVHALDRLHRPDQELLVPELLRVCDGAIVFPHVHLGNGEPEPFFERGEQKLHGSEYRKRFARWLAGSGRSACVLSEADLFERPQATRLVDDADTSHYNALVAVVPDDLVGAPLVADAPDPAAPGRLRPVANPLLTLDLDAGAIRLDEDRHDGLVGWLLSRHPMQRRLLEAAAAHRLGRAECEVLYGAWRGETLEQIAARGGRPVDEVADAAFGLERRRIAELRSVSGAMARLQCFYSEQTYEPPPERHTLVDVWAEACRRYAERPLLVGCADGSVFRYGDAERVVSVLAARMARAGVGAGDAVCIVAPAGAEVLLSVWACALVGAVAVPLDVDGPAGTVARAAAELGARLLLFDPACAAEVKGVAGIDCVAFDEGDGSVPGRPAFSQWLAEAAGDASFVPASPSPDDPAVILHTSGTSGTPKRVLLSHGAVVRSALWMVRLYGWREDDVVLTPGGLHAMSGFRNPVVAVPLAGAAAALPGDGRSPLAVADVVERQAVTVLATVPAVLRSLAEHADRLGADRLASLRQVLSTACPLPEAVARDFQRRFGHRPLDFYGATETAGLSVAQRPGAGPETDGTVGTSAGCVVQVVTPSGAIAAAGERGEVHIHSDRLAAGYVGAGGALEPDREGAWYATGDLGVRDAAGRLALIGRSASFIKDAAGDRVAAAEVAAALMRAPGVARARVRAAIGARGDETFVVTVVPDGPVADEATFVERLLHHARAALGPRRAPSAIELAPAAAPAAARRG